MEGKHCWTCSRRALLAWMSGDTRLWQGESKNNVVPAVMAVCAHYPAWKALAVFHERCNSADCEEWLNTFSFRAAQKQLTSAVLGRLLEKLVACVFIATFWKVRRIVFEYISTSIIAFIFVNTRANFFLYLFRLAMEDKSMCKTKIVCSWCSWRDHSTSPFSFFHRFTYSVNNLFLQALSS